MSGTGSNSEERSPEADAAGRLEASPACPFCESSETRPVSAFGSHASLAAYWCDACRTPFEGLRWKSDGPGEDVDQVGSSDGGVSPRSTSSR
jgi:hypothetical protein